MRRFRHWRTRVRPGFSDRARRRGANPLRKTAARPIRRRRSEAPPSGILPQQSHIVRIRRAALRRARDITGICQECCAP
jgi:hypothetical protein